MPSALRHSLMFVAFTVGLSACESETGRAARVAAERERQARAESLAAAQRAQARLDSIRLWAGSLRLALGEGSITDDNVTLALDRFSQDPSAVDELALRPLLDSVRIGLRAHYAPRLSAWADALPDFPSFVAYYKQVNGNYANSAPLGPILTRAMRQAVDSIRKYARTLRYWGTEDEAERWTEYSKFGGYYINQKFITDNVSPAVESDVAEEDARRYFAQLEAEFRRNEAISARIRGEKARRTPTEQDSVRRVICSQFGDSTSASCR